MPSLIWFFSIAGAGEAGEMLVRSLSDAKPQIYTVVLIRLPTHIVQALEPALGSKSLAQTCVDNPHSVDPRSARHVLLLPRWPCIPPKGE